jgi:hypothetical protein
MIFILINNFVILNYFFIFFLCLLSNFKKGFCVIETHQIMRKLLVNMMFILFYYIYLDKSTNNLWNHLINSLIWAVVQFAIDKSDMSSHLTNTCMIDNQANFNNNWLYKMINMIISCFFIFISHCKNIDYKLLQLFLIFYYIIIEIINVQKWW